MIIIYHIYNKYSIETLMRVGSYITAQFYSHHACLLFHVHLPLLPPF